MWCIIIPIIVGILCAIFGYLLRGLSVKNELLAWDSKNDSLQQDFNSTKKSLNEDVNLWKNKFGAIEKDLDNHKNQLAIMVPISERDNWQQKYNTTHNELETTKERMLLLVPRSERDDWKTKHPALILEQVTTFFL